LHQSVRKPLICLTRANCAQMFFIYSGHANRVVNFLKLIERTGLGDRNLAIIRDPYHENYARGVSDDIPDLVSLFEWHKAHLRQLPQVTDVYHIGSSSGGYGALLFGHLLGAKKVWAFGPRTAQLKTADAAKALLKELLSDGTGETEYFIHYAATNHQDRAFAEYFAKCPRVVLLPYEEPSGDNWDHNIIQTMMDNGDIGQLFPEFVAAATRE
jgi:hypothetical protein